MNIALISENKSITYNQLTKLQRDYVKDIAPRSLVVIICSNTLDSIIFYTGCLNKKIVPMLVDGDISEERLRDIVDRYHPGYIFQPKFNKDIENTVCIREYEDYKLYETSMAGTDNINEELALLLSTSGSTGSSKFVRISYENIRSNTESIVEYLKITDKDISITTLPMSYTYGLSIINTYLYVGGTIIVTEKKIIEPEFWELVYKNQVTSISGVPFTYEVLKRIGLDKVRNSSIRTMTQAGGRLSEELQKYFGEFAKEQGINFYIMYGQTEATARMTYLPPEYITSKTGSVGVAILEGEVFIDNGEIIYKGKNVTMGYAENFKDLKKSDEFNGILYTGDMGYMDDEGFLYVTGRKDKFAKLFGKRINLNEVENYLERIFAEKIICQVDENNLCVYSEDELEEDLIKGAIHKYLNISYRNIRYEKIRFRRNSRGKVVGIYE
ncbi:MAG: AMP-binding protein [Lachnospiraceae bacterium]|nr:AMP-binding protein [Lachnospiraceae bacterium]